MSEHLPSSGSQANSGLISQEKTIQDIKAQDDFGMQLIESRISIFRRILPDPEAKSILNYRQKLVNTLTASRLENIRMAKEFERQVLKEALDWVLTQGKIKTRKEKGLHVAEHAEDYAKKMSECVEQFWDRYIIKKEQIDRITDVDAKMGRMKHLKKTSDDFMYIIETLMDEFKNILKEGV